jgi:hypothetical protein
MTSSLAKRLARASHFGGCHPLVVPPCWTQGSAPIHLARAAGRLIRLKGIALFFDSLRWTLASRKIHLAVVVAGARPRRKFTIHQRCWRTLQYRPLGFAGRYMYFRLGRAPASCASTTAAMHILLPLGRPLRSKEFGSAGAPPSLLGCHSERVAILNTLARIQDRSRCFSLGRKTPLFALGLTSCPPRVGALRTKVRLDTFAFVCLLPKLN